MAGWLANWMMLLVPLLLLHGTHTSWTVVASIDVCEYRSCRFLTHSHKYTMLTAAAMLLTAPLWWKRIRASVRTHMMRIILMVIRWNEKRLSFPFTRRIVPACLCCRRCGWCQSQKLVRRSSANANGLWLPPATECYTKHIITVLEFRYNGQTLKWKAKLNCVPGEIDENQRKRLCRVPINGFRSKQSFSKSKLIVVENRTAPLCSNERRKMINFHSDTNEYQAKHLFIYGFTLFFVLHWL